MLKDVEASDTRRWSFCSSAHKSTAEMSKSGLYSDSASASTAISKMTKLRLVSAQLLTVDDDDHYLRRPPLPARVHAATRACTPPHPLHPTPTIPSATLKNEAITITNLNTTTMVVATLILQTVVNMVSPTTTDITTTMVLTIPMLVSPLSVYTSALN